MKPCNSNTVRNDIPCITVVKFLIERIKKPKTAPSELARALQKENINISELQVKRFFKKTAWKKNADYEVICILRELSDEIVDSLSLTNIFTLTPVVDFKTRNVFCSECHARLKLHHTDIRKIYTLHIGEIKARRTFMYCADCNRIYSPEEFEKIVPPHSNVGYDVMVLVGRLIFCEHHTLAETVLELEKRNIHISTSEVAYLSQKFIIYLSILHGQAGEMLKTRILQNGGYILHIDGTSEGASPGVN